MADAETTTEATDTTEGRKKGGKVRKLFFLAALAGAAAAAVRFLKGRGYDEGEWQELPPPQGG